MITTFIIWLLQI